MQNPQRSQAIAWRKLGSQAVILELGSERLFHELNEVGTSIWELADGSRDEAQIAARIAAEFEVSEEEARADTAAFLDQLRAKGLVVGSAG